MGNIILKTFYVLCSTFYVVLCLPSTASGASRPLPPILQILEKEPATLEDVDQLIDFRWFEKAWDALQNYPPQDEGVLFLRAKALMGLRKYEAALKIFQTLSKQAENPETRKESILKKAMILTRLKRYEEAIGIYEHLTQRIPVKRMKGRLAMRAFKVALEAKDYGRGLRLLKGLGGLENLWWRGWCQFRLGRWAEALQTWEHLSPVRGKAFYPQVLYWRAYILESQGQTSKSKEILRKLIAEYPLTFYGFSAGFKLDSHFDHLSSQIPADEGVERIKWEERYPRSYRDRIEKEAKRRNLDPYFLFAVIWQESRFQEEAVSSAGAIGLMQLMPQTALLLASHSKAKHFQLADILDPAVNIHLGSFYLKFLKKLFSDQTPYTLAAYNAGEEAVSRWLSVKEGDPIEIFIEEIPFDETRDYVKKVLTAYWIYQSLYEGSLSQVDSLP